MKAHYFFYAFFLLWQFLPAARAESLADIFSNAAPAKIVAMPRRANILFIQADGLGYGDLSCYGQTKFQTPNLDKLAAAGIRFTNYYAVDSTNFAAQAALLLGEKSKGVKLGNEGANVAQMLKQSGYCTGFIGEWRLGDENSNDTPAKKGFDEFAGYFDPADAENYYADFIWSLPPHYSYDKTSGTFVEWNPVQGPHIAGREMLYANTQGKNQYIPDLYTKAAINFIENNHPDAANRYRPFFLMVNYVTPRPNLATAKRTGNGMQVPSDAPFSDEPWPQTEKNRAAMISRLDGDIGKIIEQLQKNLQASNTVVFFSSASIAKSGGGVDPKFFSSNVSSNDFRVPMIVSWPGKIPAGRVSKLKWDAADFGPTALDIAYLKPAANFSGISILPVLRDVIETNTPAARALLDRGF